MGGGGEPIFQFAGGTTGGSWGNPGCVCA